MRLAVVGHVEWVEFVEVDRVPAPGQIAHGTEAWAEPAGGGAVAAVQLLKLAGACDFYTALGDDDLGRRSLERLSELGLDVLVQWQGRTRRALTHVDLNRERTITTVGPKLLWTGPLLSAEYDAIFFVAGDVGALHSAREARFLSATPRELETLLLGAVRLDLLVGSGNDPGETYDGGLEARIVVATDGVRGGLANGLRYASVPARGPVEDTYGAGDSFAAALTFALARGERERVGQLVAAQAGAAVVTGKGPYAAQLDLRE